MTLSQTSRRWPLFGLLFTLFGCHRCTPPPTTGSGTSTTITLAADPCPTDIDLIYAPILPRVGEDVKLTITATDSEGIDRIELELTTYSVSNFTEVTAPSLGATATTSTSISLTSCTETVSTTTSKTWGCPIPASSFYTTPSLARVKVTAFDATAIHLPTIAEWDFATAVNSDNTWGTNYPDLLKVPLPILRSVGDVAKRIDVAFVGVDNQIPSSATYTSREMYTEAVYERLLKSPSIEEARRLWSFYTINDEEIKTAVCSSLSGSFDPDGASNFDAGIDIHVALCGQGLSDDYTKLPTTTDPTPDGIKRIYLHDGVLVQVVTSGTNSGNVFSSAMVHEIGHGAFYLSDEYTGGTVFDNTGIDTGVCETEEPDYWFNNILSDKPDCDWTAACFPDDGSGDCLARTITSGGGIFGSSTSTDYQVEGLNDCVMKAQHCYTTGDCINFKHNCDRRTWKTYHYLLGLPDSVSLNCSGFSDTDTNPAYIECVPYGHNDCARNKLVVDNLSPIEVRPAPITIVALNFTHQSPTALSSASAISGLGLLPKLHPQARRLAIYPYTNSPEGEVLLGEAPGYLGDFDLSFVETSEGSRLVPLDEELTEYTVRVSVPADLPSISGFKLYSLEEDGETIREEVLDLPLKSDGTLAVSGDITDQALLESTRDYKALFQKNE